MQGKSYRKRCEFANVCPVFKGEKKAKDIPLYLFRNVFCNRGVKGWENCDRYMKLKLEELKETNKNAAGEKN